MALDVQGLTEVVREPDAGRADATAVGDDVTLQLIVRFGEPDHGLRRLEQRLIVSGLGAVIVELGAAYEPDARHEGVPEGEIDAATPLAPPRPFRAGDAAAALGFDGPLLYLAHAGDDDGDQADDLAVARDGDAIVVWRSVTSDGEPEPWFEQARVRLAPGATVVAT